MGRLFIGALDGDRNYLSDLSGPQAIYDLVEQMIIFNREKGRKSGFVGLQTDIEIQDRHDVILKTFHNELATSKLDRFGGGVFKSTQFEDREFLLSDYLNTHQTLKARLSAHKMLLAVAVPSWFDDYYGEELSVNYQGVRLGLTQHLLNHVDHFQIMSYKTDPLVVMNIVKGELAAADARNRRKKGAVKVWLGPETHRGNGADISYGDHEEKNSREAVLEDLVFLEKQLKGQASFQGINIHSWEAWQELKKTRVPERSKMERFLAFLQGIGKAIRPSCLEE